MAKRVIEIEIGCCGDCPYYDYKKHRCSKGATDEGEATDNFYADCPLNYREKRTSNKQIEGKVFTDVDILANDLNQHCADLAETYCGDTNCLTCLAHSLTNKGYRKASDVAEEVINNALSKIQIMISAIKAQEESGIITEFNGGARTALVLVFKDLAELKKKYTEGEG